MTRDEALTMMSEVLDGVRRSEMAQPGEVLSSGTVLIGPGSVLDSLGFVTFVAEIEDRLNSNRSEPIELILTDIWEFNAENPSLTASILADYCAKVATT